MATFGHVIVIQSNAAPRVIHDGQNGSLVPRHATAASKETIRKLVKVQILHGIETINEYQATETTFSTITVGQLETTPTGTHLNKMGNKKILTLKFCVNAVGCGHCRNGDPDEI